MPMFRELWKHIGKTMPKKGRGQTSADPLRLPSKLLTALNALYGHYEKTFEKWQAAGIRVPPCFIVVCNNTATSKLIYDYISGFHRPHDDGSTSLEQGRLRLFRNFDEHGQPIARPRTLLIDSEQLDSGEALDREFRTAAADEIDRRRLVTFGEIVRNRHPGNLSDRLDALATLALQEAEARRRENGSPGSQPKRGRPGRKPGEVTFGELHQLFRAEQLKLSKDVRAGRTGSGL